MELIQLLIIVTNVLALWFVGRKESWGRLGYIFGLTGQVPWAINFIITEQWMMFILWTFCTYCWCQGIYNFWIKK